jgi:glucose-6-phosphate isomerase, archaeal
MQPLMRENIAAVDWNDGSLSGPKVEASVRRLGQLEGIFADQQAWSRMAPDQVVYRVQWVRPVGDGTVGGLFWGNTTLEPGQVGDEYFMTHGHSHAQPDRAEFYATVQGNGMLLFMNRDRDCWVEEMRPGSLHYVHAHLAHRAINTGATPLRFVACWPSDAGHDYASIAEQGFSARVLCRNGRPQLVSVSRSESAG